MHNKRSQISGATIASLVGRATWPPTFVHPWINYA